MTMMQMPPTAMLMIPPTFMVLIRLVRLEAVGWEAAVSSLVSGLLVSVKEESNARFVPIRSSW